MLASKTKSTLAAKKMRRTLSEQVGRACNARWLSCVAVSTGGVTCSWGTQAISEGTRAGETAAVGDGVSVRVAVTVAAQYGSTNSDVAEKASVAVAEMEVRAGSDVAVPVGGSKRVAVGGISVSVGSGVPVIVGGGRRVAVSGMEVSVAFDGPK